MQETDSPIDPKVVARRRQATIAAAMAVLGAGLVARDFWPTIAGLALSLAALIVGIVALVKSKGMRPRGLIVFLCVLAIAWGALNTLGGAARLVVWPATQVYQECASSALTLTAEEHCRVQLNDNIWNVFSGKELDTGTAPAAATYTPTPTPSASSPSAPSVSPSPATDTSPSTTATPTPSP